MRQLKLSDANARSSLLDEVCSCAQEYRTIYAHQSLDDGTYLMLSDTCLLCQRTMSFSPTMQVSVIAMELQHGMKQGSSWHTPYPSKLLCRCNLGTGQTPHQMGSRCTESATSAILPANDNELHQEPKAHILRTMRSLGNGMQIFFSVCCTLRKARTHVPAVLQVPTFIDSNAARSHARFSRLVTCLLNEEAFRTESLVIAKTLHSRDFSCYVNQHRIFVQSIL